MASARKHISTLVVILMTAFCLAEDEKSKHHPPPPPPCGHAVCEGYNDDLGFVIAEKTITFRLKLDEDPCGIQGGQQCGPKPEEPPKMDKPKVESEEDSMEKEHNDSMANSTMETPKEMDMEEKKTPPPPPPPTIPALMGPSSVERHNGKVCKKVAVATMVGWFFLERSKSSGGEFVNSRGNKIKTGAMFSSPSCQVTEKMMIPNSASTSNPGKNVAASHFRLKVDFPGVLNGSNASLMIDFYVMLEDGNYTYEGETVLVSKGHVRISFNISDVENWFCDGSLCADYAKLGFKVNVEKPHFPKAVALNDVMCTNDTCTKSAHIIDNTRIGMLLLAGKSGVRTVVDKNDVEVGLLNSIKIAKMEAGSSFSFDILMELPKKVDQEYEAEEKGGRPAPGEGGAVSKAASPTSSVFSLATFVFISLALVVLP